MRPGSRIGVAAVAALLGGAGEGSAERNPDIRVRLRIADDAAAGTSESMRDVREILREGKGGLDGLVEAAPEGDTDLLLVVTNRASGIYGAARRAGDPSGGNISYALQALLVDTRRTTPVQGRGILWRQAALDLLKRVREFARDEGHTLLRRRPDWPAVGFEFEPLTKEHEKEIGAKGGAVLVTEVAPQGPAARAGLRAGDAIAKAAGRKVDSASDLARTIYSAAPGAMALEVAREGSRRTVSLTLP